MLDISSDFESEEEESEESQEKWYSEVVNGPYSIAAFSEESIAKLVHRVLLL